MTTLIGRMALVAVPAVPPARRSDLPEIDAALERPGRRRLADGSFACERCGGDGGIDVCYGHPGDPNAPGAYVECPDCLGRRSAECVVCSEPARIEGEDPAYIYCGEKCAAEDSNAPRRAS